MESDPVVIVEGVRTPIGRFGGSLKDIEASELAAICIREILERSGVAPNEIDEVVLGQVAQVGPDAYNARRAALSAGLPACSTAMNVNRLCSSGLQAIVSGAQQIMTGQATIVAAGGNESMSRQPFLDYGARDGWRLGERRVLDGTLSLVTDPFGRYPMGVTAERVADRYGVNREEQDEFALRSQERAAEAIASGLFERQIVGVPRRGTDEPFVCDEHPRSTTLAKLAALKPAFLEGGSVTAGNSSGLNDGAAAVLLMRHSEAERRGLTSRLTLRSWAVTGIDPEIMGYAPAASIPLALKRAGFATAAIDIFELNEAFAAQAVAVARDVGLPDRRVNPFGGAIALGHPVGATGAMLTVKLMYGLEDTGGRRGVVSMCIGGGQGMAAVFERRCGVPS